MITSPFVPLPISLQPDRLTQTHSLKYQWSTTPGCKAIVIRKLVFVITVQLLFAFRIC